jgi:Domain of unknown function (DUF4159)
LKLLMQSAVVTVVVLSLAMSLFAQRIANWGEPSGAGNQRAEFSWSRLSYTTAMGGGGYGGFGGGGGYGRGGGWGQTWSRDYPKADRQFLIALNRLTRIEGRQTEQVVGLDNDDIYNYPFVYAVMVHTWTFNDDEAKRMRDYLLKGGFLMVDDFHGTQDWEDFMRGMRQIFPDANKYPVEDLTDKDEIFHVLYDMDDRFQVPGEQFIRSGRTYEKDGYVAKWRGIRDEHGRLVVAICHNMHLGDAWEWADDPEYPEQYASMAFRVGLNYVMYSMTH